MLSLPPNERTGDHRDKPTSGTHFCPWYISRTSNCLSLKVSLLFFLFHLCHSLSLYLQVFSHSGSLVPHSPTPTSHSSREGRLLFFSPQETHTNTLIHARIQKKKKNHCPGIGDSSTTQCPIIAPMCQAKHQYTAP